MGGVILLLASFFSCKDSGRTQKEVELAGDTYMSVSMSMPQESLRAGDDDYNKKGTYEGIDKIKDLTLYIAGDGKIEVRRIEVGGLAEKSRTMLKTHPFQVKSGEKAIYAVVNISDEVRSILDKVSSAEDLKNKYASVYEAFSQTGENKIAKKEGSEEIMIMSGAPVVQDIKKGVSEVEAETKNKVRIQVKRAAARVSVTTTAQKNGDAYDVKALRPGNVEVLLGKLTNLEWSVGQYDKKYNLLQTQTEPVLSPAFEFIPTNATYQTGAPAHYDYSQVSQRVPVHHLTTSAYTADDISKVAYKYISETTHKDDGYRKGNTAYVLVKAKFAPADDMWAVGEKTLVTSADADIFLGLTTGKFYSSEQKAKDAGNNKVVTYKKGVVYYYSWVNPNTTDPTTWTKSPVRRNNIYNVNISKFRNIGLSGNPFNPDPNDPDKPDPDDPDKPDPEEPLPIQKTFMVTEVTIVPWTWHNYDIEL